MNDIEIIKKDIKNKNYIKAEAELKKLILINPENFQYHLLLGFVFEKKNKYKKAIDSYENAKKIKVDETVLTFLSNIYVKVLNYDKAFSEFKLLIKINNKNPISFNNFGLLLVAKKKENESIKFFQKAISLDANYKDAKYNLLEILEKTNKINIFKKTIIHQIKKFPDDMILKYYYAVYLNLKKQNEEAIKILEEINFSNYLNNWEFRRLNLIAKIYDEIQNYHKAFSLNNAANKFLIKNFCKKSFNEKKYYKKLENYLSILKKIKQKKIKNKKNSLVFIVGFPRSGTTLLDSILSSHSMIQVIEEKPFIEKTISILNNEDKINCKNLNTKFLRKNYITLVQNHIGSQNLSKKIIVDKMPLNLIYLRAINIIFPGAKVIFCMRHPLDTILSSYFQNFVLNEAMVNFLDLKRTAEIYSLSMEIFSSYDCLQSDNFMMIKYENLVTNFEKELKSICNFIGIKKEKNMIEFYKNIQNKTRVRTASYNQVNKPLYQSSIYKWKNYQKELFPIMHIVQKWILDFGYNIK